MEWNKSPLMLFLEIRPSQKLSSLISEGVILTIAGCDMAKKLPQKKTGRNRHGDPDSQGDAPHDDVDISLGKQLKLLRVRVGKTQADIAEQLSISAQQYQKYEKGATKCSLSTLYKLAQYYDMDVHALLPREDAASGFHEDSQPFIAQNTKPITDEAEAISELFSIFVRIPSQSTRRKVLDLLNDFS